ncbi:MAG: tetratricopeptide repeat protein, partial [Acidobacteriota bacterium]
TDYQRDLSVSFNKMGDLYRALGEGLEAREAYQRSLDIALGLAASEPDRTDYQRDLSVSFNKMGGLFLALEQYDEALEAFGEDLAIAERLASSEPDRADYQVDLAISLQMVGKLQGQDGLAHLQRALSILETLDEQGQLAPADQPGLEAVREAISQLED